MDLIFILLWFLLILIFAGFSFPLPINDTGIIRYRTIPWVTLALILLNAFIFVLWLAPDLYGDQQNGVFIEPDFDRYMDKINKYGYVEQSLHDQTGVAAFATFSSMFMHVNFQHLLLNMIFLWTFGRRVEDACGSWRFLLFYLLAGMVSNVGSVLLEPSMGDIPSIGASGAISGVMGAYLLLFPKEKIACFWGFSTILNLPLALIKTWTGDKNATLWRWMTIIPAWQILIFFVGQNLLPSIETIQGEAPISGVNYLAHFTGLMAGLTIFLFVRKDLLSRYIQGRSL